MAYIGLCGGSEQHGNEMEAETVMPLIRLTPTVMDILHSGTQWHSHAMSVPDLTQSCCERGLLQAVCSGVLVLQPNEQQDTCSTTQPTA